MTPGKRYTWSRHWYSNVGGTTVKVIPQNDDPIKVRLRCAHAGAVLDLNGELQHCNTAS